MPCGYIWRCNYVRRKRLLVAVGKGEMAPARRRSRGNARPRRSPAFHQLLCRASPRRGDTCPPHIRACCRTHPPLSFTVPAVGARTAAPRGSGGGPELVELALFSLARALQCTAGPSDVEQLLEQGKTFVCRQGGNDVGLCSLCSGEGGSAPRIGHGPAPRSMSRWRASMSSRSRGLPATRFISMRWCLAATGTVRSPTRVGTAPAVRLSKSSG